MPEIELRYQRLSDAKRYYEILNNPNFKYLPIRPKSVEAEKKWLAQNPEWRKKHFRYNYAIIYNGKLAGACGIKVYQHEKNMGEIGYFIDEAYWGKGIMPRAVKILEKIAYSKFNIDRTELYITPKNKSSIRVAEKCGYTRERKVKMRRDGKLQYFYLFGKVK